MNEYSSVTNIENIPSVEEIIKICNSYPTPKSSYEDLMIPVSGIFKIDMDDINIKYRHFYAEPL